MLIKVIVIIGILLLYLVRFRPSVIKRIFVNEVINYRVITPELIILALVILQLFGYTVGRLTDHQWLMYFGTCLFILGLFFSLYSRLVLGNEYMPALSTKASGRLVTSGPFKIVRHPVYFGGLMGFLGLELALNSPLIFLIVVIFPLVVKQINIEEKILLFEHSDEWGNYTKQTRFKLIPFVY